VSSAARYQSAVMMPASEHDVQMSSSSDAKEEEQCVNIQGDLQASSSHFMLHRDCLPELKAVPYW